MTQTSKILDVVRSQKMWLISILFALFLIPVTTEAQTVGVNIEPIQPRPFEPVIISLNSPDLDLDRSTFLWSVDGSERLRGTGEKTAFFTSGAAGSITSVRIVIQTPQGKTFVKNLSIRPVDLDILWEGYTYTPPFYKGKSLSPSGGAVVLTAIPNIVDDRGFQLQPEDFVYTWRNQGIILGESSGVGKNQITLENGFVSLETLRVTVGARSLNGKYSVEESVEIPIASQQLLFYEKHPLEGIRYEHALTNTAAVDREEIVIRAEPFQFSLDDYVNGELRYRWKINGRDISIPLKDQINEVVLRVEGNRTGTASVSLKTINTNLPFRVFQEAFASLQLNLLD